MFTVGNAIEQLESWVYYKVMDMLNQFNQYIGNMGADLFDNNFIQGIIYFFQLLATALFLVGTVVAILEYFISYDDGRGSLKDTGMNIIKGMFASYLFANVPVKLYQLSVNVEAAIAALVDTAATATHSQASVPQSTGSMILNAISYFSNLVAINPMANIVGQIASAAANSEQMHIPEVTQLFFLIAFAYAFIKILFGNLKRGAIILIQICVCSLYMFSIPRGYLDGFISWCKQVIGLCFTALMQNLMLVAGLYIFKSQMVIGTGLMLAGAEVPRIAQLFGLDTSTKTNLSSAVHTASSIISLGKTFVH